MNNQGQGFESLIEFLRKLQANNSKAWMDQNRKEYQRVRDFYVAWLDMMNIELAKIDPDYYDTPGKKAINRINNNLMFHPNRPVYKDHFGAGLDQLSKQGDFYIEVNTEDVFIGGGYWHPDPKSLRSIRQAIDYDGERLQAILNKATFKKQFGTLIEADSLTRAPKGFAEDHPQIDLLKRKAFAVSCQLPHELLFEAAFNKEVIRIYKEMLPFRRYLNQAVTV